MTIRCIPWSGIIDKIFIDKWLLVAVSLYYQASFNKFCYLLLMLLPFFLLLKFPIIFSSLLIQTCCLIQFISTSFTISITIILNIASIQKDLVYLLNWDLQMIFGSKQSIKYNVMSKFNYDNQLILPWICVGICPGDVWLDLSKYDL